MMKIPWLGFPCPSPGLHVGFCKEIYEKKIIKNFTIKKISFHGSGISILTLENAVNSYYYNVFKFCKFKVILFFTFSFLRTVQYLASHYVHGCLTT